LKLNLAINQKKIYCPVGGFVSKICASVLDYKDRENNYKQQKKKVEKKQKKRVCCRWRFFCNGRPINKQQLIFRSFLSLLFCVLSNLPVGYRRMEINFGPCKRSGLENAIAESHQPTYNSGNFRASMDSGMYREQTIIRQLTSSHYMAKIKNKKRCTLAKMFTKWSSQFSFF
jgi:hypothetical protein